MNRQFIVRSAASAVAFLLASAVGQAKELPLGTVETGRVSAATPSIYTFTAEQPGVLTVAVRSESPDADLGIWMLDDKGEFVDYSDRDAFGDRGSEQLAIAITQPGTYTIEVHNFEGRTAYQMTAGFLAFEGIARRIEDFKPTPLKMDETREITLDVSTPMYMSFTAEADGTLTVVTAGIEGDIVLSAHTSGVLGPPAMRSDQDIDDDPGNEALEIELQAGQTIHVAVAPLFGEATAQLAARFVPKASM